jgi:hypothetical protein
LQGVCECQASDAAAGNDDAEIRRFGLVYGHTVNVLDWVEKILRAWSKMIDVVVFIAL